MSDTKEAIGNRDMDRKRNRRGQAVKEIKETKNNTMFYQT